MSPQLDQVQEFARQSLTTFVSASALVLVGCQDSCGEMEPSLGLSQAEVAECSNSNKKLSKDSGTGSDIEQDSLHGMYLHMDETQIQVCVCMRVRARVCMCSVCVYVCVCVQVVMYV